MIGNAKQKQSSSSADSALDDGLPFDLPAAPAPAGTTSAGTASAGGAAEQAGPPPADPPLSNSERALGRHRAPDYLDGLNPAQRDAVLAIDGPVLVLAGAGTGKTRVLTTRIAHILATGRARGPNILAVTFTNKAAREMKERIAALVGGGVEAMPWLGTFHAIGVKILRRHAELVGLKSGFTILDPDDQIRLLKQVIEANGLDKDRWPARQLAGLIDDWKNRGLTPDKVPAGEAFSFASGRGGDLYRAYQLRLKELNACDFGDLLLECLELFLKHPDILKSYQDRFQYMLVDEYQDTNVAQYLWLRLLAQKDGANICCVGDDDQSIYGWRGAEVDNILRFDKDFPGAEVIRLERNYRSTSHILATASGLIAHNKGRLGKTLFTDSDKGELVTLSSVWDDQEEARMIADEIEQRWKAAKQDAAESSLKSSFPSSSDTPFTRQRPYLNFLNEIAILVRASAQMRAFEDRFITLGLPYRVIGGPRFYERQEIRDAIAYLEVTANPSNDIKFERIVNVPKRGIGAASVQKVRDLAHAKGYSLYDAARIIVETEELTGKARHALERLIQSFERWRSRIDDLKHVELAELILDESGYTGMWQADKSPQAQSRLENLKELVRFMHDFDSLGGFLEHVSLVMDAEANNDGDRVSLMTLHAAKGLEFDTVYLPGWEEGLFPHQRSLDDSGQAGLEEERRLAYVGLTRAKKRAKISFTQNRRTHGLYQAATPSRFIDELPTGHLAIEESQSPFSGPYRNFASGRPNPYGQSRFDDQDPAFGATYETPGWQRAKRRETTQAGKSSRSPKQPLTIEGQLVAASTAPDAGYTKGDRVTHQKFGDGTITHIDGNKLSIKFDKAGDKRVIASFVTRL